MRSIILAVTLCLMSVSVALAQTPLRKQGPGLKDNEDARYAAEIQGCRNNHPPPPPNFAARGRRGPRPTPTPAPQPPLLQAIPGVVAAGAKWHSLWHESGNNADGIVATQNGDVLVAQQDNSDVVRIDPRGHATVVYRDTNTGGALSMNKRGELFIGERGLHESIDELAPQRKVLADSYQGDSLDCVGGGMNDLTAAANGGVYFTMGKLYYAAPDGTVSREGDISGFTNGIILSADEKTLYVTAGQFGQTGALLAFDVGSDGMLTHQREFAELSTGGDGSTIDSQGRIYTTAGQVIDVISAQGRLLGVIPGPRGDSLISVAFGGPGKHTLYAVGLNSRFARGGLGLPSDRLKQGGEVVAIHMLAAGYAGRAK